MAGGATFGQALRGAAVANALQGAAALPVAPGFFNAVQQGVGVYQFGPTLQTFARSPGVLSGISLIETSLGVIGADSLVARLVGYGVKLALRSDEAAERAAAQMVDAMRGRVRQDTGRLLNGITWSSANGVITVEASAINDRTGFDYARAKEFGHQVRGRVADDGFFGGSDDGSALRGSSGGEVRADPYFWPSAREGLSDFSQELRGVAIGGAREGGF